MPATPPTTGCTPAMPNKKEKRSEGSCASRTTASATEREHVLNQRADIRNWRHPGDAQQEGIKVGLQLRERDDRTGNRGQHVLNQRADIRNRPDHIRNRRHRHLRNRRHRHLRNRRHRHLRNRRDLVRNRGDRIRNRGTEVRVVFRPILGVRAARLVLRLSFARRWNAAGLIARPSQASRPWCPCRQARPSAFSGR